MCGISTWLYPLLAVSVGYQYAGCGRIFWDKQATTLSGFFGGDLSSSDRSVAKGWSLDIQHFYNYQEGGCGLVTVALRGSLALLDQPMNESCENL